MFQHLFNTFHTDCSVITPNRRLANSMHLAYAHRQRSQAVQAWSNPDILPLSSWLSRFSGEEALGPLQWHHLMSQEQSLALWQSIIHGNSDKNSAIDCQQTVQLTANAYQLCMNYQIPLNPAHFEITKDSAYFYQWLLKYKEQCAIKRCYDHSSLIQQLIANIKRKHLKRTDTLIFVDFLETYPLLEQLIARLKEHGINAYHFEAPSSRETCVERLALNNIDEEILTMAQWAKSQLTQINNNDRIACIVPELATLRTEVARTFAHVFRDEMQCPNYSSTSNAPYNISLGENLSNTPLVATALNCLALKASNNSIESISALIRTPFIGNAQTHWQKRVRLDAECRALGQYHLSLSSVSKLAKRISPEFATRFIQFATQSAQLPKLVLPSEWAVHFSQCLATLGWPGERSLNSEEYQTIERWKEALETFSALDLITGACEQTHAQSLLHFVCQNIIFQQESPTVAIQILGLYEASGLPFTKTWVMGMDNHHWPKAAKANPLIPASLQKKYHIAHSSAASELLFADIMTQHFIEESEHCLFSYSLMDAETPQTVSRLIKQYPEIKKNDLNLPPWISVSQQLLASQDLEIFDADFAPAVKKNETIYGGTGIFKSQAACPFKAFSEFRLYADSLGLPMMGLDPLERGTIVHDCLEHIWNDLESQEKLLTHSENECHHIVQTAIDESIHLLESNSGPLPRSLIQLEQQRLKKCLLAWLAHEQTRSPFSVIANEKEVKTELGGLAIRLFIDRIDELEDGSIVLIDYKTGKPSVADWFDERPNEPQLPIYCVIQEDAVHALTYAEVRSDSQRFKGISQEADIGIKGIHPLHPHEGMTPEELWENQVERWRVLLEDLANAFLTGHAEVDPKDSNVTCQYCELHVFCRVDER